MTLFQKKVYELLKKIPKGSVSTYTDIAKMIKNPKAVRAVGTALSKNPHLISIPCHRVVKNTGEIGQYATGTAKKIELLKKEGVEIISNKVDLKKYKHNFNI